MTSGRPVTPSCANRASRVPSNADWCAWYGRWSDAWSLSLEAAHDLTLDADEELLRRAVENIVRNAVGYAPRASKISLSLTTANGSAYIRIRDRGPGVPSESLVRIFEPFYRVDPDRNRATGGAAWAWQSPGAQSRCMAGVSQLETPSPAWRWRSNCLGVARLHFERRGRHGASPGL